MKLLYKQMALDGCKWVFNTPELFSIEKIGAFYYAGKKNYRFSGAYEKYIQAYNFLSSLK